MLYFGAGGGMSLGTSVRGGSTSVALGCHTLVCPVVAPGCYIWVLVAVCH
jgi:hypothetical protein